MVVAGWKLLKTIISEWWLWKEWKMIKKTVTRYYVEVIPKSLIVPPLRLERQKEECRRIINEIKRHVDGAYASLQYNYEYRCEFCGSKVADEDDYECCEKSVDERESK